MKNKSTLYFFVLAIFSMISLSGTSLFANSGVKMRANISGPETICLGGQTTVEYKTDRGMMNYRWSISGGGSFVTTNDIERVMVNWEEIGSHQLTVSYEDPMAPGSPIDGSYSVLFTALPADAGQIIGPDRVCQGQKGVIYTVPVIDYAEQYVWMVPEGASIVSGLNTNEIKVDYGVNAHYGNILVFGVSRCGEGNVSPFFPIGVHEIPETPQITQNGNILHSSSPDGNLWYCDGVIVPGGEKQDLEATRNGRYWTIVTLGGCSSTPSNKLDVELSITGISNTTESAFSIFPIPSNGKFTVTCRSTDNSQMKLRVYNSIGGVVYQNDDVQWDAGSGYQVDIPNAASGLYSVVLQNAKNYFVKNILIKK